MHSFSLTICRALITFKSATQAEMKRDNMSIWILSVPSASRILKTFNKCGVDGWANKRINKFNMIHLFQWTIALRFKIAIFFFNFLGFCGLAGKICCWICLGLSTQLHLAAGSAGMKVRPHLDVWQLVLAVS